MQKDDYNPTGQTLTVLMVLAVAVAVILGLLCGCRTVTEVERVAVHDTVWSRSVDTVRVVQARTEKDTVWLTTERVVTLKADGDTLKIIERVDRERVRLVVDSTDRFRRVADSLYAALTWLEDRQKTVVKKESWWSRWKWRVLAVAALGVGAVGWVRSWRGRRNRE